MKRSLVLAAFSVTALRPMPASADDIRAEDALVQSIEAYLAGRMIEAADACERAAREATSKDLAARATQHCGVVRHVQGRRSDALVLFMRARLLDPGLPGPEGVSPDARATHDCAEAFLEAGFLPDAVATKYGEELQHEPGHCPVGDPRQAGPGRPDESGSTVSSMASNDRGAAGAVAAVNSRSGNSGGGKIPSQREEEGREESRATRTTAGHWLFGSGIGAAALGGIGLALSRTTSINAADEATSPADLDDAIRTGQTLGVGGSILIGTGVGMIIAAVVAYYE